MTTADATAQAARAPCGLLTVDHKGTIVTVNDRFAQWLGISAPEVVGTPLAQHFTKASRIVFETSIVPLLTLKGQVEGASLDLVTRDGVKVPVLLSAERGGAEAAQVTRFAFLYADARRTFERELAKARAEAETRLSISEREGVLREQFIAVLGHDLRNPLTSISAAMRMLSKEPLSEKGQEVLTLTQGSVQRMSLLITNVLDFARHRLGGGIGLKMSEGQVLEAEIRQVVAELHTAHPEREIKLEVAGVDAVTCDVPRVGQLLSNLLGNALTYGDPTLPIVVEAGLSQEGVFTLSVENHGPPIPEQALERLFEPFVRSTDDGNPMGLGLGLYIAAQIAKAHGGTLDVVSDEDGTRFTCQIPQEPEQAAAPTA